MNPPHKRILFVDDEAALLGGLQNLLRKERGRWDMVFAVGGQQALIEMRKAPADVVVTDMRMPEMDGVTLLRKIKEEFPSTARIVLSGYAEREAIFHSLSVAHQFLSKPCDADTLRTVIERTCNLQQLLHDESLRRVVGGLEKLPSVSRAYTELNRLAGDPSADMAAIAHVVESDPSMSARVLQLVNSAYFGVSQRIASVRQAVSYLGLDLLKGLALTACVFGSVEAEPVAGFSLDELQRCSVLTARVAKRFLSDPKRAEEAFTSALVHDLGKAIIAIGMPAAFAEVLRKTQDGVQPYHQAEREVMGITHAEVGAYLFGLWGLPFPIVETVAFHHNPGAVDGGQCEVLAVVHAADALVDRCCRNNAAVANPAPTVDMAFLERNGFGNELPRWQAIADEESRTMNQRE
jgi:HD-like signal output (HDOD) protein